MPLFDQQLQEVKRPIRLAAREMIQRVPDGIAVFFGGPACGHQVRGSGRISASSKQSGEETRGGGMPHEERMETLRKCERLLDWRACHVQGKEPVRARKSGASSISVATTCAASASLPADVSDVSEADAKDQC